MSIRPGWPSAWNWNSCCAGCARARAIIITTGNAGRFRSRNMAGSIKDKVAVIGVGCTKFGDNFDQSFEDLLVEAGFAAFADARIEPDRVEAAWLGTFSPYAGNGKAAVSLADS